MLTSPDNLEGMRATGHNPEYLDGEALRARIGLILSRLSRLADYRRSAERMR